MRTFLLAVLTLLVDVVLSPKQTIEQCVNQCPVIKPSKRVVGRIYTCTHNEKPAYGDYARSRSVKTVIKVIENGKAVYNASGNTCLFRKDNPADCLLTGCAIRPWETEHFSSTGAEKPKCPKFLFNLANETLQVRGLQDNDFEFARSLCDKHPHSIVTRDPFPPKQFLVWELKNTNPGLRKKKKGPTYLSVALVTTNNASKWKNQDASLLRWSVGFTQTVNGTNISFKDDNTETRTIWANPKAMITFLLDRKSSVLHVVDHAGQIHLGSLKSVPESRRYLLISLHTCTVYMTVYTGAKLERLEGDMIHILGLCSLV